MNRRLPNLNAIRAFDAAARHQSFSRAAEEIGVTHASVSRYVKNLEADLGLLLFERHHRQVVLTAAGARYAEIVADALMLISLDAGMKDARNTVGKVIVEADSDLALLWLLPFLEEKDFASCGIELEVRSCPGPPRTIAPDTDLALTWGAMDVPGFSREHFLDFRCFPVCAPEMVSRVRTDGLAAQTLVINRGASGWDEMLKHQDADFDTVGGYLTFHRTYLCLDAAVRGLGVAIGDDVTARCLMRDGKLVQPCGPNLPGRKSYYLSSSSRGPRRPAVETVRQWLLECARNHTEWADQSGLLLPK